MLESPLVSATSLMLHSNMGAKLTGTYHVGTLAPFLTIRDLCESILILLPITSSQLCLALTFRHVMNM